MVVSDLSKKDLNMAFNTVLACAIVIVGLFLELIARDKNRSVLGYVEEWNRDGTAKRVWYILAVSLFTQRWNHSTSMEK